MAVVPPKVAGTRSILAALILLAIAGSFAYLRIRAEISVVEGDVLQYTKYTTCLLFRFD